MITNSKISNFQEVLCAEHACLNDRRRANGQTDIRKFQSDLPPDVQPTYETVGLALSGGGVRSAAMSLGVLQSLDNFGVLEKVDYLSTVSGGGYIGCSLSATMTLSDGRFAFADAKAVAQLRDRSNYLLPPGKSGQAIAIILRGLVANFSMVLAVLLLFAAGTIILHPKRSLLPAGSASLLSASSLPGNFGAFFITILQAHFGVLICFGSFVFLFFLLWAFNLIRLRSPSGKDLMPVLASLALIGVGVVFFFELQPFLIAGMFDRPMKTVPAILAASIIYLAFFAVPISLLVAFFRRPLGQLLVRASDTTDFAPLILGLPGRLALWLACIALPLSIWITYLYLSYWGIANVGGGKEGFSHTPRWLFAPAGNEDWLLCYNDSNCLSVSLTIAGWYFVIGVLFILFSSFISPNEVTLHGLYRDRLSKAFLFDPNTYKSGLARKGGLTAISTSRQFAATQHFGRFWSEADIGLSRAYRKRIYEYTR